MEQMNATGVSTQHVRAAPLPVLQGFASMKRLHNIVWPSVSDQIVVPKDFFGVLLRLALENIPIDEDYYLSSYPDVVEALKEGLFSSPRHHYLEFGYFEDRLPFRVEVDKSFYLWAYPDVNAEVKAGTIVSAQEHFEHCGYKEGRMPRESWSLMAG